ncbi:MAG: enolase C-terminal domain-like protein [Actinomycetota bacterium]
MARIIDVSTAVVEANFDYTLIRIDTDEGPFGIGECFFAPGLPAIARELGTLLHGADPRDIRTLTTRMQMALSASSGPAGAGAGMHAVSGIETALWDLAGKLRGEPVWRLLGGRYRDRVPVYADLHAGEGLGSVDALLRSRIPFWASESGNTEVGDLYWTAETETVSPEAIRERVREAARAGFRCVKLDMDVFDTRRLATDATLSSRAVRALAESAAWLRAETDPGVEIAYDCHWRFDLPTARALHAALTPAAPLWLEDPVPASAAALASVAEAGTVAIASGENAYRLAGIEALAADGGLHDWPIVHLGVDRQRAGMDPPGPATAESGDSAMMYYPPAVEGYCANVGRVQVLAAGPGDLPAERRDIVERLFAPIYRGYAGFLRRLGEGVTGDELWQAATGPIHQAGQSPAYDPCSHIGLGEWENVFVFSGSQMRAGSGMVVQADFTVVADDPALGVGQIEDGFAVADADLREEIASRYPEMWERVRRRRESLAARHVSLHESVLPLGDMVGQWRPYALDPDEYLTPD